MKNLVLQIDIKSNYDHLANGFWRKFERHPMLYRDSKKSALEYSEKYSADYLCLTNPMIPLNMSPIYQKFSIYPIFEKNDYDKIYVLDCDVIVYSVCPNIFEYEEVCGVHTCPPDHDPYVFDNLNLLDIPKGKTYDKYFCSGNFMVTRDFYNATKEVWYEELLKQKDQNSEGTHDQTLINRLVYKYYDLSKVRILNDDWGVWYKNSLYMNHLAGLRKAGYGE